MRCVKHKVPKVITILSFTHLVLLLLVVVLLLVLLLLLEHPVVWGFRAAELGQIRGR